MRSLSKVKCTAKIKKTEQLAVILEVKIKNPKGTIWGGTVSGPIFSEIGREILWRLGIPPSFPNEINQMGADPSKNN